MRLREVDIFTWERSGKAFTLPDNKLILENTMTKSKGCHNKIFEIYFLTNHTVAYLIL